MSSKLFKVIYGDKKIGIVADCLAVLQLKSKEKLNIEEEFENLSFCLEDGTEIIDDESFQFLEKETVLKILDGKVSSNASPKSDGDEGPAKKRTKADDFLEDVKDSKNIPEIVGKAIHYITSIEKDYEGSRKYQFRLSLRSRIEFLEKLLWRVHLGKQTCRQDTWLTILASDDPYVLDLKQRMKDLKLDEEWFIRSIEVVYGDCSDRGAHNVPLPKEITDADITNVLTLIEVQKDEPVVKTIKVLISPLKSEALSLATSNDSFGIEFNLSP